MMFVSLCVLCGQVLYKLGLKDRKFGTKARLCQALLVTLSLVNEQLSQRKKQKRLLDLLSVLKLYCNNREYFRFAAMT